MGEICTYSFIHFRAIFNQTCVSKYAIFTRLAILAIEKGVNHSFCFVNEL